MDSSIHGTFSMYTVLGLPKGMDRWDDVASEDVKKGPLS